MTATVASVREPLPRVFYISLVNFAVFITLGLLGLFWVFHLPDTFLTLAFFYSCPGVFASVLLAIWSGAALLFQANRGHSLALISSLLMAVAVPFALFFLSPLLANWAVRIEVARTASLADFQAWAQSLIDTPSTRPEDDWFSGSSLSVPPRLRPFTSHFMVAVERDISRGEEAHVLLIAGGGFSEMHSALEIGKTTFVPHDEHRWRKWADGIYYTFP
jgi:hypothetical protein